MEKIKRKSKLSVKQFILNTKFLFSNKYIYFNTLLFILLTEVISCIFSPFAITGAIKLEIGISIPILLILGSLSFEWKRSTLNKNQIINGISKFDYYISLIITIFVWGNILMILFLSIDSIFFELGLQLNNWIWEGGERIEGGKLNLQLVTMIGLIYVVQLNLLILFAIYFVAHRLFPNIKSYYIFICIITIICVIFGGLLNNPFITDFAVPGVRVSRGASIFPIFTVVGATLFFPLYSPAVLFQIIWSLPLQQVVVNNSLENFQGWLYGNPFWFLFNSNHSTTKEIAWTYKLVVWIPFIHIILSASIGTLISKIKE